MGVQTTKNTANSLQLPAGTIGALLSGLAKYSVHAWVWATSLTTGANDNGIVTWMNNGTTVAGELSLSGASGAAKVRATGRSVSTDGRVGGSGATSVATGAWRSIGAVFDIAGDQVRLYLDGVLDGTVAAAFANATYTQGTPTIVDTIGGLYTPTPATTDQFDGHVAEVAFYGDDILVDGFGSLAAGYPPFNVMAGDLLEWWSLRDNTRLIGGRRASALSIVGSIPTSTVDPPHPRILLP